jgi:predicted dehydrogenase
MRALLIGAGGMGQGWASNLNDHPEVELAGWVDVRPGAAAEAAAKKGLEFEYYGTDLAEAIDRCGPDFVVDVTPPEVHHRVTLTALGKGIPVIGEKPMANSMAEAREMVKASEDAGKLYMVSQSRRYIGQIVAFRNLINERIGPLGILNADFFIGAHFGGFRDEMPSPLVLDMAIHTFDEARDLTGTKPVSVYADEFNPAWSWYKGDVSANAIFEFEDGLRFAYRGSWCAEGLHTSWDGDWRAVGPNGTAVWHGNQTPTAAVVTKAGGFHSETEVITAEVPQIAEGISGSLAEFIVALKGGPTPQGECHDNIFSLAMVFAAIESNRRGEKVQIEEILLG